MKEIDTQLDDHPELALEMVELDSRNRQAHAELQLYNDHRNFRYKHSLTQHLKEKKDIILEFAEMKHSNPERFVKECANVIRGLNRYGKMLCDDSFASTEAKEKCEENLSKYKLKHSIIQMLIGE
ncbi:MAG: hypothetical protein LBR08_11190 [Bacteroidales bacterium]|jgi:hypothetical protein|nr:hypothetical protein [Bacteroidales bacterium]